MTQPLRTRPDDDARDISARRKAGLVMLLSALGTGGAAVVWAIFGPAAAALVYAVTIAVLYGVVLRLVAAPRALDRSNSRSAAEASPLRPGPDTPPAGP